MKRFFWSLLLIIATFLVCALDLSSAESKLGPTYVPSSKKLLMKSKNKYLKSASIKGRAPKSYLPRDSNSPRQLTMTCDAVPSSAKSAEFRLPLNVIPEHYDLELDLDLHSLTFSGRERISVSFYRTIDKKLRDKITLHSVNLNLTQVQLFLPSDPSSEIKPETSEANEKLQTVTFTFPDNTINPTLTKNGILDIEFNGVISDKLNGLYRSKYSNKKSASDMLEETPANDFGYEYYATTQFESIDARKAFPCFDEPALKATFNVSLITDERLTSLTNGDEIMVEKMPIVEGSKIRKKRTTYEKTPKMSTYLLAFIVGSFDFISGKTKSGTLVRVFTPRGRSSEGEFGLDVAIKSLDYFEEYFNIKYPMSKCDQVSINDFEAGAMENWGIITYRESALLVNPETSLGQKQQIALTVAHEVAHQWFGNLVTMNWWTDLWLNEGFASFMMYQSVNEFFPSWNLWLKFVTEMYASALALDSFDNSHPIQVPIEDPNDIHEIFDAISYRKGSSVLRMLNDWVGADNFRRGLQLYLKKHQFGNTCTRDLWSAIEVASGSLPVNEVMSSWTEVKGYPLVTVTETQRTPSSSFLTLSQRKFSASSDSSLTPSEKLQSWNIPIKYTTGSSSSSDQAITTDSIMSEKNRAMSIPVSSMSDWIKFNSKSIGFYRTQYKSASLLNNLIPAIKSKSMNLEDRLQIQADYFALVHSGYDNTDEYLSFLNSSFPDEDNYFVWTSIDDAFSAINTLLSNSPDTNDQKMLNEFVIKLLTRKIYSKINWDASPNEPEDDSLLRTEILGRLALSSYEPVIAEAKKRFSDHVSGAKLIPADLRSMIYRTVSRNSSPQEFQVFFELYSNASASSERNRLGSALGSTKDPILIPRVIEFAMNQTLVRAQDAPSILSALAVASLDGRNAVWEYFKRNIKLFYERYSNDSLMSRMIKGSGGAFGSEAKAVEIEAFFKKDAPEVLAAHDRAIKQTIEAVRIRSRWSDRDLVKIRNFLARN